MVQISCAVADPLQLHVRWAARTVHVSPSPCWSWALVSTQMTGKNPQLMLLFNDISDSPVRQVAHNMRWLQIWIFFGILLMLAILYLFTGRQCLCTGERDWIRAVSSQWALLRPGQREHWHLFQMCFYLPGTPSDCTCFPVWEHLLLQLGAAGSVFLPTIPRENLSIPESASAEGEPAHLPCRPLP